MKPYEIDTLIDEAAIAERIDELAADIDRAFADTDKLVLVGLLRGSFIFIADLARQLSVPVEIDFLEVSSYGDAMVSSREVRVLKDMRSPIEGRDVLVVEDIIDTGHTLSAVRDLLTARGPRRLEICALLDKPSRREAKVAARWIGFTIPDAFVVGYGIDYAQRNRNLPYIGTVRFLDGSN
jgi:hypoxanthine phosphoribosyltransferase